MKRYSIIISPKAQKDIDNFYRYINDDCKQQAAATRNRQGLYARINRLSISTFADAIGTNEYVQKMFGPNARHITYKKMAIVYIVRNNTVYIKRVIASSLIH